MELEKSNIKNNIENNNKKLIDQKVDIELKRFKSHEVYLVTQKNPKNSSKDHKKIYINISQRNKIKPKPKKSFNNNSNAKPSKNKTIKNTEVIFEEGKQLIKRKNQL